MPMNSCVSLLMPRIPFADRQGLGIARDVASTAGTLTIDIVDDGNGRLRGLLIHEVQMVDGKFQKVEGSDRELPADYVFLAMGFVGPEKGSWLEQLGVQFDERGNVRVDQYGRTSSPGVWALGDINGRYQLKHMANGEAKVVRHNLMNPNDLRRLDDRPAPHAVFGSPQVGAVGLTEDQIPVVAEHAMLDIWIKDNARPVTGIQDVLALLRRAW